MTESRQLRVESVEDFTRQALMEISAIRQSGIERAGDIATALNRGGFSTWNGQQWDAGQVLDFLASPDTRRMENQLR